MSAQNLDRLPGKRDPTFREKMSFFFEHLPGNEGDIMKPGTLGSKRSSVLHKNTPRS